MSSEAVAGAELQSSGGTEAVLNGAVAASGVPSARAAGDDGSLDRECESLTKNAPGGGQNATQDRSNGVITPPLPKGCVPLSHQVAGHMYGKGTSKAGLLQDGMGTVLKPGQNACRGKRERTFYHNVTRPDQSNPLYTSLRPFVPRFYGTFVSPEDPSLVYLKINDVTLRFRKPCVMDVKIGCKSYEDGVSLRKVELAKEKYPNLEKIGFQILGMRVYHPATDEFECRDKFYGRSLQGDNVIEGFARYLNVVDDVRIDVVPEFLKQMRRIERWFTNQKQLNFYSSSLLFVYEGAVTPSPSQPLTETVATPENDGLSNSQPVPNFVSYSQLKRVGPKSKQSASAVESLPPDSNVFPEQGEHPPEENGFVNRLPTYQESIAAKLGHKGGTGPVEGGLSNGAEGAISNGGQAEPQLLDINGRLTVSQMRERQRSLSNGQSDSPSQPEQPEGEPMTVADVHTDQFQPIEAADVSADQIDEEKESDSKLALVKMIDFTHVVDADRTDENYLFGLRNVIRYFEMLLNVYGTK
ncbi:inositol polyphosphate multikinase-like [Patiria miniata]|uniref:Kinase n=1 Tax=Patiria miniata TaxID=46514 RepID=A0A914AAC6_PATMI|nr:inositol polyphosphate multikinase-like [Patiria miniata]